MLKQGKLAATAAGMALLLGMMPGPYAKAYAGGANPFGFINGDLKMPDGSLNTDAEPQIRSDADGNFYISSERGLGGGTDAWKSTDGGKTYTYLGQPNALSQTQNLGVAPGGGDTDVAVAPEKNADGFYNVYVASLSLANVDVSTSKDGGKSWATNYASASVPVDDREWIAADGRETVYISYHDIGTFNIDVNRSDDGGATFTKVGEAINPVSNPGVAGASNNNQIGNIAVDHNTGIVYQTFVAANGLTENLSSTPMHVVYMGVSRDGGKTFSDYTVYNGPSDKSYAHQFPNVAVDQAGNVYSIFTDDQNIYYSYSTDQGKTWSPVKKVNQSPSFTSIEPWAVGGSDGRLGIVWYGTSGSATDGAAAANNEWYVYYTLISNANTAVSKLNQTQASPVVHKAGVCEDGIGCGPNDNRDLYDDFGVAVNPMTGYVSIAYSYDQPSNTYADSRTRYATQTSGPRLIVNK